ncbi:branched-chain amino acid ABC transporter permease [Sphaerimonospora thailandensis]|uniref:Branched-chain amino acid ABC transporter permease n=1 Tax=Sphaerimonospora thailandensis TaxID=795644 RepID=A0A8J3R4H1_9ACTN|nr:branched-chain amino acid ABC transporter permease [Sphaerimonospora thailandensis]GIH68303.1 branched-chain amino acid ABC transporter permease [Sphaerimonospora thailandensis]
MNANSNIRSGNPLTSLRRAVGGFSDGVRDWWAAAPRWTRWTVYGLLIALVIVAPHPAIGSFMSPYSHWPSLLFSPIGTFVLLAVGLNVVVGQAGLLDLGFVAFYAIGAYTMAVFATKFGWNFWGILVIAIFMTAVSGIVLGSPTLRLRGDYLAIVTLGFGEIVRITAQNTDYIGGARGITNIPHPPTIFGVDFALDPLPYYYLLVAAIVLVVIFAKRLERSRVGRAWEAIREDEDAAELMGVPTFRFKLLAFFVGAMIGGLTGAIWASKVIAIQHNNFPFILSATILAAVVLGGSGNLPGVIIGAFLIAWLPERFRGFQDYRILIFGGALVLMMALRPEGLLPARRRRAVSGNGGESGDTEPGATEAGGQAAEEVAK